MSTTVFVCGKTVTLPMTEEQASAVLTDPREFNGWLGAQEVDEDFLTCIFALASKLEETRDLSDVAELHEAVLAERKHLIAKLTSITEVLP